MKREDVAADVAAPIEIDITGPLADEGTIRRFLQSDDFALVLARVTEAARTDERARIRGWLGQQAGKADRESRGFGDRAMMAHGARKAFKEAADHLKPKRVSKTLAAKRAARKAVSK